MSLSVRWGYQYLTFYRGAAITGETVPGNVRMKSRSVIVKTFWMPSLAGWCRARSQSRRQWPSAAPDGVRAGRLNT